MTYETDATAFLTRLKQVAGEVEALLDRLLGEASLPGEIARPARLLAAMRHGVLAGGKRLRPAGEGGLNRVDRLRCGVLPRRGPGFAFRPENAGL